jgi:hypothetical protein
MMMKIALNLCIVLVVLFTFFQIYVAMAGNKTETQAYDVVKKEDNFEIRFYPVATLAVITANASSYRDLGNVGFRKLAGFIFGGNQENKSIAMTSPVHMEMGDSVGTMAFVLPKNYNENNLPKPNDSSIKIKTTTAEYVAAIEFGGFSNTKKIDEHIAQLKAILLEKKISYRGNFRYLGYNPPYQLFGRKNEIVVTINYSEINK